MTPDIRKCAVCGRSYDQARKLFNEFLRSSIKIPKTESSEYLASLEKLLAEVESFRNIIEENELPDYPLKELLYHRGDYFNEKSILYRLVSADDDTYIFPNELTWFEQYLKHVSGTDIGVPARQAIDDLKEWLEKEMHENIQDPGGFSHSVDTAIEEASNLYSIHSKTVHVEFDWEERLSQLLSKGNPELHNVIRRDGRFRLEKQIDICWICLSLYREAIEES